MNRLCLYSLIVGLLLTGCGRNPSETIVLYGRDAWTDDNSTIQLKEGYFVRDYSIDYENKTIVMNLERDEELIEKKCKTCMNYGLNLALCKRCIGGSGWINRHNIDKKQGERSRNEEVEAKIGKITIEEIGGRSFVCVYSPDGDRVTYYPVEEYGKRWCIMETRDDRAL